MQRQFQENRTCNPNNLVIVPLTNTHRSRWDISLPNRNKPPEDSTVQNNSMLLENNNSKAVVNPLPPKTTNEDDLKNNNNMETAVTKLSTEPPKISCKAQPNIELQNSVNLTSVTNMFSGKVETSLINFTPQALEIGNKKENLQSHEVITESSQDTPSTSASWASNFLISVGGVRVPKKQIKMYTCNPCPQLSENQAGSIINLSTKKKETSVEKGLVPTGNAKVSQNASEEKLSKVPTVTNISYTKPVSQATKNTSLIDNPDYNIFYTNPTPVPQATKNTDNLESYISNNNHTHVSQVTQDTSQTYIIENYLPYPYAHVSTETTNTSLTDNLHNLINLRHRPENSDGINTCQISDQFPVTGVPLYQKQVPVSVNSYSYMNNLEENSSLQFIPMSVNPNYLRLRQENESCNSQSSVRNVHPKYNESLTRRIESNTEKGFTSMHKIQNPSRNAFDTESRSFSTSSTESATKSRRRKSEDYLEQNHSKIRILNDGKKDNTQKSHSEKVRDCPIINKPEKQNGNKNKIVMAKTKDKNRNVHDEKSQERLRFVLKSQLSSEETGLAKYKTLHEQKRTKSYKDRPTNRKPSEKHRHRSEEHRLDKSITLHKQKTTKPIIEHSTNKKPSVKYQHPSEERKNYKSNKITSKSKRRSSSESTSDSSCHSVKKRKIMTSIKNRSLSKHYSIQKHEVSKKSVDGEKPLKSSVRSIRQDKGTTMLEREETKEHSVKSVVKKMVREKALSLLRNKSYKKFEEQKTNKKQLFSDNIEDLREKLPRRTLNQCFTACVARRNCQSKLTDRDNLIITVDNEDDDKKSGQKSPDIEPKNKTKLLKGKKSNKIKVVINIKYDNAEKSSSNDSDDTEDKSCSESSNLDLSFLDLNVDDIVSCLQNCSNETDYEANRDISRASIDLNVGDIVSCLQNCSNKMGYEPNVAPATASYIPADHHETLYTNDFETMNRSSTPFSPNPSKNLESDDFLLESKDDLAGIRHYLNNLKSPEMSPSSDNLERPNSIRSRYPSNETLILPLKEEILENDDEVTKKQHKSNANPTTQSLIRVKTVTELNSAGFSQVLAKEVNTQNIRDLNNVTSQPINHNLCEKTETKLDVLNSTKAKNHHQNSTVETKIVDSSRLENDVISKTENVTDKHKDRSKVINITSRGSCPDIMELIDLTNEESDMKTGINPQKVTTKKFMIENTTIDLTLDNNNIYNGNKNRSFTSQVSATAIKDGLNVSKINAREINLFDTKKMKNTETAPTNLNEEQIKVHYNMKEMKNQESDRPENKSKIHVIDDTLSSLEINDPIEKGSQRHVHKLELVKKSYNKNQSMIGNKSVAANSDKNIEEKNTTTENVLSKKQCVFTTNEKDSSKLDIECGESINKNKDTKVRKDNFNATIEEKNVNLVVNQDNASVVKHNNLINNDLIISEITKHINILDNEMIISEITKNINELDNDVIISEFTKNINVKQTVNITKEPNVKQPCFQDDHGDETTKKAEEKGAVRKQSEKKNTDLKKDISKEKNIKDTCTKTTKEKPSPIFLDEKSPGSTYNAKNDNLSVVANNNNAKDTENIVKELEVKQQPFQNDHGDEPIKKVEEKGTVRKQSEKRNTDLNKVSSKEKNLKATCTKTTKVKPSHILVEEKYNISVVAKNNNSKDAENTVKELDVKQQPFQHDHRDKTIKKVEQKRAVRQKSEKKTTNLNVVISKEKNLKAIGTVTTRDKPSPIFVEEKIPGSTYNAKDNVSFVAKNNNAKDTENVVKELEVKQQPFKNYNGGEIIKKPEEKGALRKQSETKNTDLNVTISKEQNLKATGTKTAKEKTFPILVEEKSPGSTYNAKKDNVCVIAKNNNVIDESILLSANKQTDNEKDTETIIKELDDKQQSFQDNHGDETIKKADEKGAITKQSAKNTDLKIVISKEQNLEATKTIKDKPSPITFDSDDKRFIFNSSTPKDLDYYGKIEFKNILPQEKTFTVMLSKRIQEFLKKPLSVMSLIRKGRFSKMYYCKIVEGEDYAVKIIMQKDPRQILGIKKEKMIMKMQEDIPKENLNSVLLLKGFGLQHHWCFFMEYCSKNLHQVLSENKAGFHIDKVRLLSQQLVTAVTVLRNNQIVHGEIDPSHILLTADNRLKLCGFDSAFYIDDPNAVNAYKSYYWWPHRGFVNYRAPELLMGYKISYGIDIWTTAMVIFHMATNRTLVTGANSTNQLLFKLQCILGNMPRDMVETSTFSSRFFDGILFIQEDDYKKKCNFIPHFYEKPTAIRDILCKSYHEHWGKHTFMQQRHVDMEKLKMMADLLEKMLVLHPKDRMAIEFVYGKMAKSYWNHYEPFIE